MSNYYMDNHIDKLILEDKVNKLKENLNDITEKTEILKDYFLSNDNLDSKKILTIIDTISKINSLLSTISSYYLELFQLQKDVKNINQSLNTNFNRINELDKTLSTKIDKDDFDNLENIVITIKSELEQINNIINDIWKEIDNLDNTYSEKLEKIENDLESINDVINVIQDNIETLRKITQKSKKYKQNFIQSIVLVLLGGSSILGLIIKYIFEYLMKKWNHYLMISIVLSGFDLSNRIFISVNYNVTETEIKSLDVLENDFWYSISFKVKFLYSNPNIKLFETPLSCV